MEFKSQICTTKEQSERLLALGLKKETADMKHFFDNRDDYSFFHRWKCWPYKWDEESLMDDENIPAWSLHRLIEMLPPGYREMIRVGTTDNPYEYMYQVIGRLVYIGEFNKKYLEE